MHAYMYMSADNKLFSMCFLNVYYLSWTLLCIHTLTVYALYALYVYYIQAVSAIRNLNFVITDGKALTRKATKVAGVGKKLAELIDRFLKTGTSGVYYVCIVFIVCTLNVYTCIRVYVVMFNDGT